MKKLNHTQNEESEVSVSKEQAKKDAKTETNEAFGNTSITNETCVKMPDAKSINEATEVKNGVPESCIKPTQMETNIKVEGPMKKVKKTNTPKVEFITSAILVAVVKLSDPYYNLIVAFEEEFTTKLQEPEDWLQENGKDETKVLYVVKPKKLWKQRDFIKKCCSKNVERKLLMISLLTIFSLKLYWLSMTLGVEDVTLLKI
ncbi:hypothetical protein DITRI_Ditri04bG0103900 [Diplodiscus trichospermus]